MLILPVLEELKSNPRMYEAMTTIVDSLNGLSQQLGIDARPSPQFFLDRVRRGTTLPFDPAVPERVNRMTNLPPPAFNPDGRLIAERLTRAAQSFNTSIIFSALDFDTTQWTAGCISFDDGSSVDIIAGDTGDMTELTYIFYDPTTSTLNALEVTTDITRTQGDDVILLAVTQADSSGAGGFAFFVPQVGVFGINGDSLVPDIITSVHISDNSITTPMLQANIVTAAKIFANTITAGQIAAFTITAGELQTNSVTAIKINVVDLEAVSATLGDVTTGSLSAVDITASTFTGGTFRTSSGSTRLEITGAAPGMITWFNSGLGRHNIQGTSTTRFDIFSQGDIYVTADGTDQYIFTNASFTMASGNTFNMNTGSITNAGNVELDSLTKDGSGDITVNDTFLPSGSINLGSSGSRWNAIFAVSVNFSGGATIGDSGADQFALNARLITDVLPSTDNSRDLGSSGLRWADLRSVLINGADIGLENDWKFREYPCTAEDVQEQKPAWFKAHANEGIQIVNDLEELVAVIHRDGYIYCKGFRPLEELP